MVSKIQKKSSKFMVQKGCVWIDGYTWMEDGGPWTSGVWFVEELDMDIRDRRICS
jgi:hypothetical protein